MGRMHVLLTCIVLAGFAGPASACINDNESPTHEREFRSQYGGLASRSPAASSVPAYPVGHKLLAGSGAVLLIGAFAGAATRGRVRA